MLFLLLMASICTSECLFSFKKCSCLTDDTVKLDYFVKLGCKLRLKVLPWIRKRQFQISLLFDLKKTCLDLIYMTSLHVSGWDLAMSALVLKIKF